MKALIILGLVFFNGLATAQVQFKNGPSGFSLFLRNNIIYPQFSKQNCIQGIVNVSFKLDQYGKVYTSKVTKGIITELNEEALRLIRLSSGKWQVPAGYDTTVSVVVPVSFKLSGYDCEGKGNSEINASIVAYQAKEGLMNAVINFYKNKDEAKPGQEAQILIIKSNLGIDDEYLNDIINTGLKKLKQGDKTGACEDFNLVKNLGSSKADDYLTQYCR